MGKVVEQWCGSFGIYYLDKNDILGSIEWFKFDDATAEYCNNVIMGFLDDENFHLKVQQGVVVGYDIRGEYHAFTPEECVKLDVIPRDQPVYFLKKSETGEHVLGGKLPPDVLLPESPYYNTPFQYVGKLRCKGSPLQWMGIDEFHIVFPMYECVRAVILDYSNDKSPKLVETIDWFDSWLVTTGPIGIVETKPIFYKTMDHLPESFDVLWSDEYITCGIQIPSHVEEIRRDKVDGKVMRYVATFAVSLYVTNGEESLLDAEKRSGNEYMQADYLVVFYNPETRRAYIERVYS